MNTYFFKQVIKLHLKASQVAVEPSDHFWEIPSLEDHIERHGYNVRIFEYRIKRDVNLRDKFTENVNIPGQIVPIFEP